jgi:Alpha/beta hydrolase family
MKLFFDDDELDGQLQRSVTHAYERAADVGEVLAVAARISPGDDESWYREWHAAANATVAAAEASRDAGHAATAAEAFLRATEYCRQAMFYLRGEPGDPRVKHVYTQLRSSFGEAAKLLPLRIEAVRIPYETTTLNGYLMVPDNSDLPRRTVLFPVGYDAPAEDCYLYVAPALRRGYTVLAFEGPGQGGVLYEQRLCLRPDFEHVLTPVVDFATSRPEVDADRLVLFGRSFAGYLAPRGATGEHRLAALVCDPGQVDLGAKVIERLPAHVVELIRADDPAADQALAPMLHIPAIRRVWLPRMAAHGTSTLRGYLREVMSFTLTERAHLITCPTLVTETDDDFAGGQSRQLYDLLTCPKTYHQFTAGQGTRGHMGGLAQQLWNGYVFDWLDDTLHT